MRFIIDRYERLAISLSETRVDRDAVNRDRRSIER